MADEASSNALRRSRTTAIPEGEVQAEGPHIHDDLRRRAADAASAVEIVTYIGFI